MIVAAPTNLTVTPGNNQVTLNWNSVPGADGYKIYQSLTAGSYGAEILSVGASVYTQHIVGLSNGTIYYFVVRAFSAGRDSSSSNEVSAIPYTNGSSGSGGGTDSPANSSNGEANVTPSLGGKISLDNKVALTIPTGALNGSSSLLVKIGEADQSPALPSGFMINGKAYSFTINEQNHYQFGKPVTITFTFDPDKVPEGETPCVYYYDSATSQWVKLEGTISGNTITISVDHYTIYAILVKKALTPTAASFIDLDNNWAKAAIEKLAGMGAISAYPDGTFRPNTQITRAEFITLLVKVLKLKANSDGLAFKDTADHWAKGGISVATSLGIARGYNDNSFKPDNPITREEMAVMACKAAKLTPASGDTNFSDNKQISSWAKGSVMTVVNSRIMSGYLGGTFKPQGNATRAEAVSMLLNIIK